MKVWAGEFLLEIRLAPIVFDLGVREAISSLRAPPEPRLAFSDRGTAPVPNPKLRHEMKKIGAELPRDENAR